MSEGVVCYKFDDVKWRLRQVDNSEPGATVGESSTCSPCGNIVQPWGASQGRLAQRQWAIKTPHATLQGTLVLLPSTGSLVFRTQQSLK